MSQFLNDMAQVCRDIGANIYFIGAVENGGYEAERIAVNETNFCSDIYSCAKAFTAWDRRPSVPPSSVRAATAPSFPAAPCSVKM